MYCILLFFQVGGVLYLLLGSTLNMCIKEEHLPLKNHFSIFSIARSGVTKKKGVQIQVSFGGLCAGCRAAGHRIIQNADKNIIIFIHIYHTTKLQLLLT